MKISSKPNSYILTVDIGGSHLTAGICHLETYSIIEQTKCRIEFSSSGSAEGILQAWTSTLSELLKSTPLPVKKLALAMPGPFDYAAGISYIKGLSKYESLYGLNIKQHLSQNLGLDPELILFRNDAEAAIAGEMMAGAGKNYRQAVGITLGTGFGSAYSLNQVTRDINLGSDPFKESIADNYLSTRWFVKRYYELTGISLTDGVKELASLAESKPTARQVFTEFAKNLTDFLTPKMTQYAPEALLLCGNISKAHRLFSHYLQEQLQPVMIEQGQLGENAALLGAASLFDLSEEK